MAAPADALTLPFAWYSDEELLRRERALIFARSWQYGGRADQVAEPGSYLATDAGGVPILVTRDREGVLRAFVNVCRHRGAVLMDGCGKRNTLQCHYHAWTYDLDGSLRAAPRSDREPGFDRRRLVAAASKRRHLGAVPLRQPGPGGGRRSPSTSASCRRSLRARSTSTRSSSTPASSSAPTRTGRSSSRTSSSATTARPRTRRSATRSTSIPTATCSRRIRRSQRSSPRRSRPASADSSTCSSRTPG